MKTLKKTGNILLAILFILLIAWRLSNNKKALSSDLEIIKNTKIVVPVTTEKVKLEPIKETITLSGNIEAVSEAIIVSEVNGKVIQFYVNIGDHVEKGQLLASIENKSIINQFELAKANLEKFEKDLNRYKELESNDAISEVQFNEIKIGYENALTNFKLLKEQLENTEIKSTISGCMNTIYIKEGNFVSYGTPLFEITNTQQLKLVVDVTESQLQKIKKSKLIKISMNENTDQFYYGNLNNYSVKADESRKFQVEILFNNSNNNFYPGLFGKVEFIINGQVGLTISRKCLTGSIKNPEVFIIKNDTAYLRTIETDLISNQKLLVTSGIEENDEIVNSGQFNIKDMTHVKVININ